MRSKALGARRSRLLRALLAVTLALVASFALGARAYAKSYTIDQVDIDATVSSDGSVAISEQRLFDFDGSFNGVYWKIPAGTYQGKDIVPVVGEVGIVANGQFQPFEQSSSGADGTFEVTNHGNYVQVKIYSRHTDERARFAINYTDAGLATRYQDTSELYWKFVSDGWDVESKKVTCLVHLPVPAGTSVKAGENVRAWGHGPLDANVGFMEYGVKYNVPGVGTEEFAEARIAFPSEWLSDATPVAQNHLDTILGEEQKWADEANAKRDAARMLNYGIGGAGVLLAVVSAIFAATRRRKYKQSHKPQFDDKYFRDVPTNDHPAILGALYHNGEPTTEDMTASLMRLTDIGAMKLDLVKETSKGFMGKEKSAEEYRVTRTDNYRDSRANDITRRLDEDTLDMLFRDLARKSDRTEAEGKADGVLFFSDLKKIAKKHPSAYERAYSGWTESVSDLAAERGFFNDENPLGTGGLIAFGALDFLGAGLMVFLLVMEILQPLIAIACGALLVGAAVLMFVVAGSARDLSREAIEVRAQLEALRRWLKDFTRLEEAVPTDVILWNRLLVMAVSLGVADEVIKQLKVVAPQVLDDPMMMPVYGWYYYGGRLGAPADAFRNSMSEAHKVSTAALSSSSSSSGGGGGGGFSGGGGGGFGGGGGGGAF